MPIFKMCGTLILLLAGCLLGSTLTGFEKKRLTVLEAWIDLIGYIRSQIDCYLMPIHEIFRSLPNALMPIEGAQTDICSPEAFYNASELYLDVDSRRLLSTFVREIGSSYREEQCRRCEYFIEELRKIYERKRQEEPAKIKLSWGISVCAALALAILLW